MDNGDVNTFYIVRLIGVMAIAVGVAWAVQTVGFGQQSATAALMWIAAAASAAGAGAGLVMAATTAQLRGRAARA